MRTTIELRNARRFESDLKLFAAKAIPYANRDTLNDAAFSGRKAWIRDAQNSFTIRNTWTTRQMQVVKVKGNDIHFQKAILGSRASYMADAEHGVTQRAKGKQGLPIPTPAAAGQVGASKRTKPVASRNYLARLRMRRSRRGSQAQRNASAIAMAKRSGRGAAFLETSRFKGIVRVTGGKRKTKLRTIYDLSRKSTRTAPEPTLQRTVATIRQQMPAMYMHNVIKQLKRNRVLGY